MAAEQLVRTLKERCRVCYTCVRECPAKAIRIANGQAEILPERCIGCGNCVTVCSQHAKQYRSSIDEVRSLLEGDSSVAAIIAPSFPAEFSDIPTAELFTGMVRKLGFDYVAEVSFGADLVAQGYRRIHDNTEDSYQISTDCPAIVSFVRHYFPHLTDHLVKLVSPMIAMARVMKELHGKDLEVVFIGPCIAKKEEADEVPGRDVSSALTFVELRQLFMMYGISDERVEPSSFDPPLGGKGSLYPVSRGKLHSVEIDDDPTRERIVVTEGRVNFPEVLREFETGILKDHHLELLCCEGCIMGPGTSQNGKRFSRRTLVTRYVEKKLREFDWNEWKIYMERFAKMDLSRNFAPDDQRMPIPSEPEIAKIFKKMGKNKPEDELDCGACGYDSCRQHAIAIHKGLAEVEMCLPNTLEKLHSSLMELAISNRKLANTREALKQSEKLASMGQLAAGIAHEVNNPLGVILLYSHMLKEETDPSSEIHEDLQMIASQADRCKGIVSGLLNFARKNEVVMKKCHVEELVETALREIIIPEEVKVKLTNHCENPYADLDFNQMVQVITNIVKNAVEALEGSGEIRISTYGNASEVRFEIEDNGPGIPKEHKDRLFEPFFTTKPMGKGTGLGLPVSYGIVKMHRGKITVTSNSESDRTGTRFTIVLPRKKMENKNNGERDE